MAYIFPVSAAKQVLENFRTRFIDTVNADAIVHELKHKDIIEDGDLSLIYIKTPGSTQKNNLLHDCLLKQCNEKSLMVVCEVMIAVRGNPKMKSLGNDMKSALEGKLCALRTCVCAR